MTKLKRMILMAVIVVLLSTACGTMPQSLEDTIPTTSSSLPAASTTASAPIPEESVDILSWTMQDESGCVGLTINANHEILLNDCKGNTTATRPEPLLFAEMINRFASFTSNSEKGKIIFGGKGDISGEAWQRAIDRWAQNVYAENLGHVCASCQTILVWNMGNIQDTPDICHRLTVLNFGYVYADKVSCAAGGQTLEHTETWLETGEWITIDSWLAKNLFTTQPEGYFGSNGQAMSQDEIIQLRNLVGSIYSRITPDSNATPATPNLPTQDSSENIYTSHKYGYSLSYPSFYNVVTVSDEYVEIGNKIVVEVMSIDPAAPRGDGPVIENTMDVQLSGQPAKLMTGYIGSVGGYIPQQFRRYVIERNGSYLVVTLYALGLHVSEGDVTQIAQLTPDDISTFDSMVTSMQIP